jgi:hypothetical protein
MRMRMISCVGPATALLPDVSVIDSTGRQRDPGPSASFDSQPDFRISLRISRPGRKAASREARFQAYPHENPEKSEAGEQNCGETRNLNLLWAPVNTLE